MKPEDMSPQEELDERGNKTEEELGEEQFENHYQDFGTQPLHY